MEIEDGVDTVGSAEVNDTVKVLETGLLQHTRVEIVFEVVIVEGEPNAV